MFHHVSSSSWGCPTLDEMDNPIGWSGWCKEVPTCQETTIWRFPKSWGTPKASKIGFYQCEHQWFGIQEYFRKSTSCRNSLNVQATENHLISPSGYMIIFSLATYGTQPFFNVQYYCRPSTSISMMTTRGSPTLGKPQMLNNQRVYLRPTTCQRRLLVIHPGGQYKMSQNPGSPRWCF